MAQCVKVYKPGDLGHPLSSTYMLLTLHALSSLSPFSYPLKINNKKFKKILNHDKFQALKLMTCLKQVTSSH